MKRDATMKPHHFCEQHGHVFQCANCGRCPHCTEDDTSCGPCPSCMNELEPGVGCESRLAGLRYRVHVTNAKEPEKPVAAFAYADHAEAWARTNYPGRSEIRASS